jgi:hypothetical protein
MLYDSLINDCLMRSFLLDCLLVWKGEASESVLLDPKLLSEKVAELWLSAANSKGVEESYLVDSLEFLLVIKSLRICLKNYLSITLVVLKRPF